MIKISTKGDENENQKSSLEKKFLGGSAPLESYDITSI